MEDPSSFSGRSTGYNTNQKSSILDRFNILLKEREDVARVSRGVNDDTDIPVLTRIIEKVQHTRAVSAPKILDEYESNNGDVASSHIGAQSLGSTSHVGRTPFNLGHTRPPSPALASPSHYGYDYRTGVVTAGDEDLRDWRRSHGVSNGFDIQRPRALISAYGTDERNKTTNQKPQHGKNLTLNGSGLGSKVGGLTWKNAEEEEFE
ncbi:hypothetical protein L1987_28393 [Smallanthus sonchifolius]|uniref:Uncharacterized protein n=1 Tax=Smallanthus sonchifolius TaxID=185202 RepID=A0ACB9HYK4_9ASTR|nr:hypothetical protein L1987_28393 [Smallanthus sonchifolius]